MNDPIEISQGTPRLAPAGRLSDMETPRPTPERPSNVSEQAAQNGKWRGSKEALSAPLRAVAGEDVRRALGSDATPEESQLVARNALVIAGDVQRDVPLALTFDDVLSAIRSAVDVPISISTQRQRQTTLGTITALFSVLSELPDLATVNLEFKVRGRELIGRQSQTWVRFPSLGWKVISAHVSTMSDAPPG